MIGTNPKDKVTDPSVLLPDQKTLDDVENIDTTTELLRVKSYRISEGLLAYLRSVLLNNYEGEDKNALMVSCPRSFEFEIYVLDFAVKLLQEFAKSNQGAVFRKTNVEQDQQNLQELRRSGASSAEIVTIEYNIQMKKIYLEAIKIMKICSEILKKIKFENQPFTSALFQKIPELEDGDSLEQIFEKRMGVKNYFKSLKTQL